MNSTADRHPNTIKIMKDEIPNTEEKNDSDALAVGSNDLLSVTRSTLISSEAALQNQINDVVNAPEFKSDGKMGQILKE